MKFKSTKKIIVSSIIILALLLIAHNFDTIHGYTVRVYNKSSNPLPKDAIHVHDTASWCPDSRNDDPIEAKTGYFEDIYKSAKCGGTCFDYFEVGNQKFYIPNQCSSPTIEVWDDQIYLNGSKARPYDCWKTPGWATELAGKKIALETSLLGLQIAEGFLDKVGKPVAQTGALAVRETGKGVLVAGRETALGVLTGTEEAATLLLRAVDLREAHWDGSLQELAAGTLGKLRIKGTVFNLDFTVEVNLDITKPFDALKDAAEKIVKKVEDAAKSLKA